MEEDVTRRYGEHLRSAGVTREAAESAERIAARFEAFLTDSDAPFSGASMEEFVAGLIASHENTVDALLGLARYAHFRGRYDAFEAVVLMLDAEEVPQRLQTALPPALALSVFADLPLPALGVDGKARADYMRAILARLDRRPDRKAACAALRSGLHSDPDTPPSKQFADARKRFLDAPDLDAFIADEARRYGEELREIMDGGRLYYTQPITQRVLDYVRDTPTCACGLREGDRIRVTKIPYMADRYLTEPDPIAKRRHYCHCPWARESLSKGTEPVSASMCECSAQWVGRYWEGVFDKPVQVDVVKTVLQGDDVCEFVIHVPPEAMPQSAPE